MKVIGIDPGVNTGLCVWCTEKEEVLFLATFSIHNALKFVEMESKNDLIVVVEDARLWKNFKISFKAAAARRQGAGSVKRDSKIWEDFLKDLGITYRMIPPVQKIKPSQLSRLIGKKVTGQHQADAVVMVYKYKL